MWGRSSPRPPRSELGGAVANRSALEIRALTTDDYAAVRALLESVEGVGLSDADSPDDFARYLRRNEGLSLAAFDGGSLAACVLCGHDGRRGYLHHLAVEGSHRRRGIGRVLVDRCLASLADEGIQKCHLFVLNDNAAGSDFWRAERWAERTELTIFSRETGGS